MEKKFKYKAGVIYSHESPDGGRTVYAVETGTKNKKRDFKDNK
jgi:hypothetical protein